MSKRIELKLQRVYVVIDNHSNEEVLATTDWEEALRVAGENYSPPEPPGVYLG